MEHPVADEEVELFVDMNCRIAEPRETNQEDGESDQKDVYPCDFYPALLGWYGQRCRLQEHLGVFLGYDGRTMPRNKRNIVNAAPRLQLFASIFKSRG